MKNYSDSSKGHIKTNLLNPTRFKLRVFTKSDEEPIWLKYAESNLASLIPYFDVKSEFPESLATLKIEEAINILRIIDPSVDSVLANSDVPDKIDLIDFMRRNFMFNMSLEKLGYLTGRSLSTFNRDFKKLFQTTPQKWLTDKRLELAYYHLAERKKKPTEIYLEVGFEDLSHFSFIF